mgnify:CR=1 FL=1
MTLAIIIGFVVGISSWYLFKGMFILRIGKSRVSQLATLFSLKNSFQNHISTHNFSSYTCRTKHCHTI